MKWLVLMSVNASLHAPDILILKFCFTHHHICTS